MLELLGSSINNMRYFIFTIVFILTKSATCFSQIPQKVFTTTYITGAEVDHQEKLVGSINYTQATSTIDQYRVEVSNHDQTILFSLFTLYDFESIGLFSFDKSSIVQKAGDYYLYGKGALNDGEDGVLNCKGLIKGHLGIGALEVFRADGSTKIVFSFFKAE